MKCAFIVNIEESVREVSVPNLPGVQPRWRFFIKATFMIETNCLRKIGTPIILTQIIVTSDIFGGWGGVKFGGSTIEFEKSYRPLYEIYYASLF